MAEHGDGIDEAVEGMLRAALTAAGQFGELAAMERERAARRAQSEQEAAALSTRWAAKREAARVTIAPVNRADWWESAQPEDIARVYQIARSWSHFDPDFARAEQRIIDELRARYGVDLQTEPVEPAAVAAALDKAATARGDAEAARAAARDDVVEGAGLLAQAEALNRAAEEADLDEVAETTGPELRHDRDQVTKQSGLAYDSADQRQRMVADLDGKADAEVIDAQVRADTPQALPATAATRAAGRPVPTPRKARPVPGRDTQRGGLSR